ncbi:hypothetical protein AA23498_1270 [Acetobacter nitrogenifigens DSM 23921 = NBRC 105050]|uniref:Sel1 repeat family protein n=2 Tax=Acetobacter nitrogenifigens TaxID=285268 RepID=A0A511XCT9_9PROT|nr:tetratricopeptide repeat protein [Acetobacter nitrogenifigens]GBQ91760.1 hypothetical protein AA23498_1270 [Acetobacter nitrogenifigens DSM 23921 = NBRC 105050]GEN60778.1 hypothetical protein ANI02nite_26620 [Acetobacter nitrogenifigens DSM 23921 = NBRC 105050]
MAFDNLLRRMSRRPVTTKKSATPLPDFVLEIRERAAQGHVLDQVRWGDILLSDQYGPRDPEQGREWYAIAAGAGYAPAYNMLGRCHHFGWGCPVDLAKAVSSYRAAADLGDLWGCYNLGIMTMRGLGRPADLEQALFLFRSAADRGHAKSMNLVGRFTEEGWHTPRDPEVALQWYRRSAEGGDYRGQHNYATALLEMGRREDALTWWRRAVEEATSDILLAMEKRLRSLGAAGDTALLERARARLGALGVAADQ